ncbi:MAG: hypothetical protein CMJ18_25200 [Phycisphaeraceae bacterium]|nr:hypothetical protein [Phycisphaeraceae bacterium]
MNNTMGSRLTTLILVIVLLAAAAAAFRVIESRLMVDVYRDRLDTVASSYTHLAKDYNELVKKTAVTELLVQDGSLKIIVRNVTGTIETLDTPFDPENEIYVDYIVRDGRLLIRRVYDDRTAPRDGLVVDPRLAYFDWDESPNAIGKAVYRSLDEGRWVITLTGDGALGLARAERPADLNASPSIRRFAPIEHEPADHHVGLGEVIRAFVTPG